MSIQERVNILILNLNISKAEFERRANWGPSAASRVSDNVGVERFAGVKKAFPFVNLNWIMKGEGSMYESSEYVDYSLSNKPTKQKLFANLINSLKSKGLASSQKELAEKIGYNDTYLSQLINDDSKTISDSFLSKISEIYYDFDAVDFRKKLNAIYSPDEYEDEINFASVISENKDYLGETTTNEVKRKTKAVPIIPPQAQNSIISYITSNKNEVIYVEPGQMFPAYDLIWRVPSSAMSPCVEKGDILYLKRVESDQSILNGNVYLIDSITHGIMLRIIHHENDTIECISLSKVIPPVTLKREEIKDIFSISGMFKFDVPLHKFNLMSSEYKDKEEGLRIVLNQNTSLISEMRDQGKRIDTLIDIIKNERKQS